MKRFFLVSLLAAFCCVKASACASIGITHNKYMFSVFRHECMQNIFADRLTAYWQNYIEGTPAAEAGWYGWNGEAVKTAATYKHDTDMKAYATLFSQYYDAADVLSRDSWDYPTKQELLNAKTAVRTVLAKAKAYRGVKMRPQYLLLAMRANMTLGLDRQNITLWQTAGQKLDASHWRDMMKNLYARALFLNGQKRKAYDIYAEQGDFCSLKYCVRKFRNLAGIKSIYASDPDSPTLVYLVQDFVNNAQETLDNKPATVEDEEWILTLGARPIYKDEVMGFINFAQSVLDDGKTDCPCLWRTAQGMLYYLFGHDTEAMACLDKAVGDKGTQRMKDNARCIRLLASTRCNTPSAAYSDYLVKEMTWLDSMEKQEQTAADPYSNHYSDVRDRVIYKGLMPLYDKSRHGFVATMLSDMAYRYEVSLDTDIAADTDANYSDWNEYFGRLNAMTPDSLAMYYDYLTADKQDAFEQYAASRVYKCADYYNDLIGTKMIACGRYDDAIGYLEKVSMDFINNQSIAFYMSRRDFNIERWFKRQPIKGDDYSFDGEPDPTPVMTENQKLEFCRTMSELTHTYNVMREGYDKEQQAYRLGTLTCQASYFGDCWYLTHYGKSVGDSAVVGEMDYLAETIKYLSVSKQSEDKSLRYKSIYALALLPVDVWRTYDYDTNYNEIAIIHPRSRQYEALSELSLFAASNPQDIDSYTSRCDVLKQFRQQRTLANWRSGL